MTTEYQERIRCAVCGAENEFTEIGSTNAFGSPDLDTRPPEMERSTLFASVQRCPECGFCASNVGEAPPVAKSLVRETAYQAQLNDRAYPELANSFLCKAALDKKTGGYASATWDLIRAAWACDDAEQPDQATTCRDMAAKMLVEAEKHGQQVSEQEGASTALLVDLLRRAGEYDRARECLATRRASVTEEVILRILDFQAALIAKADNSCHTIAEALGEDE